MPYQNIPSGKIQSVNVRKEVKSAYIMLLIRCALYNHPTINNVTYCTCSKVRGTPIIQCKKNRGACHAILEPLKLFSLKRSTSAAFAVPFKVLSRKKYKRRLLMYCIVVLELVSHQCGKHFNSHPPQKGSRLSLGGSFPNFSVTRTHISFLYGSVVN